MMKETANKVRSEKEEVKRQRTQVKHWRDFRKGDLFNYWGVQVQVVFVSRMTGEVLIRTPRGHYLAITPADTDTFEVTTPQPITA